MNCKPGDLAYLATIPAYSQGFAKEVALAVIGIPVRVTRLRAPVSAQCLEPIVWDFEEPIRVNIGGKVRLVTGGADEYMRPIRDPGEDAQDETLTWKPVPFPQVEAA